MRNFKQYLLNDEFVSKVSGGVLSEGWQNDIRGTIADFKSMTDEELANDALSRNCESLISLADAEFQASHGLTNDDMEILKQFILQNYDSIEATVR